MLTHAYVDKCSGMLVWINLLAFLDLLASVIVLLFVNFYVHIELPLFCKPPCAYAFLKFYSCT